MLEMGTTGATNRESDRWSRISKRSTIVLALFLSTCYHSNSVDATTTLARSNPTSSVGGGASTRRVMEPAFENAGKVPGIAIWRIEDFKPVAYPVKDYGKFYTGDSYIILVTKEKNGIFSWDIHFWLGSETSQDEAGSAAILTVSLDDQLGGDPVQYREVQDHESQLFLSRFKSGVRYLPGGVSSGFAHVDRDSFEKKLFQVKGKRNIRVKQVPLSISSMNKGDCFILDVGNDIYVYVGGQSKRTERLKAAQGANLIRDQDHGGRSKVHVLDEFASETEIQAFFDALGGGVTAADVPEESTGGDDEQFESKEERTVALYRVSDSSGRMQIQEVGQKPLKQSHLDTNDCFILETGGANLFIWIGKKCNKKEKDEAMVKAQNFLQTKNYPAWTHVERIVEDGEPSSFRQYFQGWRGVQELHPRLIRSAAARPTPLDEKSGGELPEFMPDDGSGDVKIYRVENYELVPVPVENYGKLFGGDSYVIKYHCTNGKWIIYYWQGNKSTLDDKAASAILTVKMDNDELGGRAVQIRVVQDYEPKHFLQIFKGKLIIFMGGHASGFINIMDHDMYVPGGTRLYRVRGTNDFDVRASQQCPSAYSLESDDVFIVENTNHAWLWIGKGADDVEKRLAAGFVELLVPSGVSPITLQEGEETLQFWAAIGGRIPSYSTSFKENQKAVTDVKMYHCHVKLNGHVSIEELERLEQNELDSDDLMLIDSSEEIFVWIGKGATEHEITHVFSKLHQLLKRYQRENAIVVTVKQGQEHELFTSLFPSWK
ncbi:hypothetical protein PPYR_05506 [Photinus pyralis]|uniref:Gelsolin-like domain-containing protein n=2 Tax=Photinus pyralis TaxID=7054 RepID=A0A1Y1NL72_PHOPY|nr:gelsolin, cytoplasmic isoform X2 [Photinus pyralis]KAB0801152.1 hypothetical protein PPYR_05506 [Photinus pyralis]